MEEQDVQQISRNGVGNKKLVKIALVGPDCTGKTT